MSTLWRLVDFQPRLEQWIARECPPPAYVGAVGGWIGDLISDPHRDATRRLDLGVNFWFARVPGAGSDKEAVVAFYEIDEVNRTVRCHYISTLREPITG